MKQLKKATMPVPICATVSRSTGEIRWEYSDDFMDQVRFGRVMNRLSRIHDTYEDQQAKAGMQNACSHTGGGSALRE